MLAEQKVVNGKRKVLLIVASLSLFLILVLSGIYFAKKDDLLLYGVPYYGTFTAELVATPIQATTDMILGYWGDTRFSFRDIYRRFPPPRLFSGSSVEGGKSNLEQERQSLLGVASFFTENGYDARFADFVPGSFDALERYLTDGVPVVLPLKIVPEKNIFEPYVLIGISHSKKSMTFHVPLLGNNYEVSFSDFENLLPTDPILLVVQPLESTRSLLRKPTATPYPPRLGIMDSLRRIQIKLREAEIAVEPLEKILLLEEIIREKELKEFRPDGQIALYMELARAYILVGKVDEAADLLATKAIPLNHDLDNGFGEWPAYKAGTWPQGQWFLPWSMLGDAYYIKKDFAKAREAFSKGLELDPQSRYMQTMLEKLNNEGE